MAVGRAAEAAGGVLRGAPSDSAVTGLLLLPPWHSSSPLFTPSGLGGLLTWDSATSQRTSCLGCVMLAGLCHWDEMDFVGYLGISHPT